MLSALGAVGLHAAALGAVLWYATARRRAAPETDTARSETGGGGPVAFVLPLAPGGIAVGPPSRPKPRPLPLPPPPDRLTPSIVSPLTEPVAPSAAAVDTSGSAAARPGAQVQAPGVGTAPGGPPGVGPGTGGEGDYISVASPRAAILPPLGQVPGAVVGRTYRIRFWVAADGRVTRVAVDPPIPDDGYRRDLLERMLAYQFYPARTRSGTPVASVVTVPLRIGN